MFRNKFLFSMLAIGLVTVGVCDAATVRSRTQNRSIVARAGNTNGTASLPNASGIDTVQLVVDNYLYNNYTPIKAYVDNVGGTSTQNAKYIDVVKNNNTLPNLKTLFDNLAYKGVILDYEYSSFNKNGDVRTDITIQQGVPYYIYVASETVNYTNAIVSPVEDSSCAGYVIQDFMYGGCIDATHRCPSGYETYQGLCINPCAVVYGDGKTETFMQTYAVSSATIVRKSCNDCVVPNCKCNGYVLKTDTGLAGICIKDNPAAANYVPSHSSPASNCGQAVSDGVSQRDYADFYYGGCPVEGRRCDAGYMVYHGTYNGNSVGVCIDPKMGIISGREHVKIDSGEGSGNCGLKVYTSSRNVVNGCVIPNMKCKDGKYAVTGSYFMFGFCETDPMIDHAQPSSACNNKTDPNGTYMGCVIPGYACESGYEVYYGTCINPCKFVVGEITDGNGNYGTVDPSCDAAAVTNTVRQKNGCAALNCRCFSEQYSVRLFPDMMTSGECGSQPYWDAHEDPSCLAKDADGTFQGCIGAGWRCNDNLDLHVDYHEERCMHPCGYVLYDDTWEAATKADTTCNGFTTNGGSGDCVQTHCRCQTGYKPVQNRYESPKCEKI